MDVNVVSVLLGALGTFLVGVLGVIFTKGRLAEVIVSRSVQEQTAVQTISDLLAKAIEGWMGLNNEAGVMRGLITDMLLENRTFERATGETLRSIEVMLANLALQTEELSLNLEEILNSIKRGNQ